MENKKNPKPKRPIIAKRKKKEETSSSPEKKHIFLNINEVKYRTYPTKKYLSRKKHKPLDQKKLLSFIPGTIKELYVKKGDEVLKNDELMVLEAMKMNNIILAPMDGKIKKVKIKLEETITKKQVLLEFE